MMPVSKKRYPRALASLRPSVDLPEAAGPSIAMMKGELEDIYSGSKFGYSESTMDEGCFPRASRSLSGRSAGFACIREQIITDPQDDGLILSGELTVNQPAQRQVLDLPTPVVSR
jgi:hypothetical protein